jgi:hypothetical protein
MSKKQTKPKSKSRKKVSIVGLSIDESLIKELRAKAPAKKRKPKRNTKK